MEPTEDELYDMLLEQLAEAGEVSSSTETGVVLLRGLPRQRGPVLRLHLTPALLGRALRELAPDFAPEFPRLQPLEAALVVFYLHVLAAVEKSGPGDSDIVLFPPEAGIPISVPRPKR